MKNKGFSVTELSMLLLIIGSLMGGIYALIPQNRELDHTYETTKKLQKIEYAIYAFYLKNGFLPCPASRTDAQTSSSFGLSSNCSTTPTGTTVYGTGNEAIVHGVVPVRSLNLNDGDAYDSWLHKINYSVIKNYAIDATTSLNYSSTQADTIKINNAAGLKINPSNTTSKPLYVLFTLYSAGKNAKGAYTKAGLLASSCSTGTLDNENCDDDDTFIMDFHNYTNGTTYFDDFVLWRTNKDLFNIGLGTTATGSSSSSSANTCIVPSSFSPAKLFGLILWLDASDAATITTTGSSGQVTSWTDKSAFARSFTPAESSERPVYSAAGFNSKPTLIFNKMRGIRSGTFSHLAKSNYTFVFVGSQASTSGSGYLLDTSSEYRLTLNLNSSSTNNTWFKQGSTTANLSSSQNTNLIAMWQFIDGTSTEATLYINNDIFSSGTTYIAQTLGGNMKIGAQYNSPTTRDFDGKISEFLIFNRLLLSDERTLLYSYLKAKWEL